MLSCSLSLAKGLWCAVFQWVQDLVSEHEGEAMKPISHRNADQSSFLVKFSGQGCQTQSYVLTLL